MMLAAACAGDASDMRQTAAKAQKEADAEIAAVSKEANVKVDDIEARAKKANGSEKAELEAKLKGLDAQHDAFMKDYEGLEQASAATWDATQARLERELAQLEARVAGI